MVAGASTNKGANMSLTQKALKMLIEDSGFAPCTHCANQELCEKLELYCLNAIEGILNGSENWPPKKPIK
jgi:hypothetical protein